MKRNMRMKKLKKKNIFSSSQNSGKTHYHKNGYTHENSVDKFFV